MKCIILATVVIFLVAFGIHIHAQTGQPRQPSKGSTLHVPIRVVPMLGLTFRCVIANDAYPVSGGNMTCGTDSNGPEDSGGGGGGISCTDNTDAENQEIASPTCSVTDPGSSSPVVTVGPGSKWGNIPDCSSLPDVTASTNCVSDEPETSSARSGDDACALELSNALKRCQASRIPRPVAAGVGSPPSKDCAENAAKTFDMCEKNMPNGGGDVKFHGSESKTVAIKNDSGQPRNKCDDFLRVNLHYCSRLNNPRGEALCTRTAELTYIHCNGLPIPSVAPKRNELMR